MDGGFMQMSGGLKRAVADSRQPDESTMGRDDSGGAASVGSLFFIK
jgi:hypothetical protein